MIKTIFETSWGLTIDLDKIIWVGKPYLLCTDYDNLRVGFEMQLAGDLTKTTFSRVVSYDETIYIKEESERKLLLEDGSGNRSTHSWRSDKDEPINIEGRYTRTSMRKQ